MKMAIWPVYLIALYWSFQNTAETVRLPNKHLEEAILCLREYIGEDIVHPTFRNDLSNADYLGDICKYENVNIIMRKIRRDVQDGGLRLQECLSIRNLYHLYTEIIGYAIEILANQHPEEYSDFAKYIIGLCNKDYTVDFNKLEDYADQMAAFSCLQHCTEKFLWRIESSLNQTRHKMFRFMANNQKSAPLDETSDSQEVDSNPKLTRRKYKEIIKNFMKQTEIKQPAAAIPFFGDIDTITITRKTLMTRYSQVYSTLYKYLDETDISWNEDIHREVKRHLNAITTITDENKILNDNLSESFTYYKSCAKVRCYMKAPKSVPLYALIHDEASKESTNTQQEEQEPMPEQKFYIALASPLEDENEDDDDDDDDNDDDR